MSEPTDFDDLYPGRFMKAGTLGGRKVIVTIDQIYHEDLEGEQGAQQKVIMSFVGKKMAHVLPKINGTCLRAMFGKDVTQWKGKRIVLYATADYMPMRTGEECVRVYGSPEIVEDVPVTYTPPKRKPISMTMKATDNTL